MSFFFVQVRSRWIWDQLLEHHPMDLHAPGLVWEVRLQWLGLPKAIDLWGHERARVLRINGLQVQERIPVSQLGGTNNPHLTENFNNGLFIFADTPSTSRFWAFPTTWGNSLTSTLMPTAVPSRWRNATSSSNAPTPSRIPSRGTSVATACKLVLQMAVLVHSKKKHEHY